MKTLKESIFRIKTLMKLSEVVDHSAFNISSLKELKSFKQRLDYCAGHLQRLGSGSSRIVFKIDDGTVLKLAKNRKGVSQNNTESDYTIQSHYGGVIAKIKNYCDDDLWIVCELARKVKKEDFKNLAGVSYEIFDEYMNMRIMEDIRKSRTYEIGHSLTPEQIEFCNNNEFICEILDLMANYSLAGGDLTRLSSYGVVNRDGDNTLVLVDYGATDAILQNMYMREELD